MLARIDSQDFADVATALEGASPEAAALVRALGDCCHPKAGRLLARLGKQPDAEELTHLRAEVLHLLSLTFGRAEAHRRLQ
jgi:hypothetical protein